MYFDAKYFGISGHGFYNHADRFAIYVTQNFFGSGITVYATHGHEHKLYPDSEVHYDNLAEFLGDWEIIGLHECEGVH